ncbi:MAG: formylglycine-generating enzyme family protein, partial [Deltaproteobacteria bacterium]|nr:formylglycine-generating enzyme family protein [Deltaproteobacteria bacterium]
MVPAVEGLPDDGCETRCDAEHFQGQEVCDGRDNDCDGEVDEGFDLDGDIDNCGRCGRRCLLDGVAEGLCSLGECLIVSCAPGFFDRDGEPANGCEYPCVVRGDGVERCNGLDDDCDGAVDEAAELQLPEMGCLGGGVCQGVQPSCGGLAGWYCPYPEDLVEFPEERSCDGLDNDCDGATDETFPQKGSRCLKGEGACRGEGTWQCTPDGRALHCTGTEHPELASPETCNGLDDDCDGEVDNDPLDLIWVQAGAFRIFAYEASRPDAGPERAGVLFGQACSRPGVLPWNEVSHEEAALGCALGGWRLCTLDELRFACGGPAATRYPYGNDFREDACNGGQADPATGHVAATGAFAACTSSLGAFDLSGNLKEWTATPAQAAAGGRVAAVHLVTGGAYDSSLPASLGCGAEPVPRDDSFRFPNLGFRCCWP